jgi:hypothetical protein
MNRDLILVSISVYSWFRKSTPKLKPRMHTNGREYQTDLIRVHWRLFVVRKIHAKIETANAHEWTRNMNRLNSGPLAFIRG